MILSTHFSTACKWRETSLSSRLEQDLDADSVFCVGIQCQIGRQICGTRRVRIRPTDRRRSSWWMGAIASDSGELSLSTDS